MSLPNLSEERLLASIEPKSDQLSYDDFVNGPKTYTVAGVSAGSPESPVQIRLENEPRFYRPGKSMRRVLVWAWGKNGHDWVGRSMTLYGDPTVKFGGVQVGGIRISHMSDIDGTQTFNLTSTRGKKAPFKVLPLTPNPAREGGGDQRALEGCSSPEDPTAEPEKGVTMLEITEKARSGTESLEECIVKLSNHQMDKVRPKLDVLNRIAANADLPEGLREKLDAGGYPLTTLESG